MHTVNDQIRSALTAVLCKSFCQSQMRSVRFIHDQRNPPAMYDLRYLLSLYLIGPSSDELVSPLPWGTRLLGVSRENGTVTLELTDTAQSVTDTEFTLACACLTMTTLSITGGDEVTITSGSRSVTMSRDSLTLIDDSTASTTEETK